MSRLLILGEGPIAGAAPAGLPRQRMERWAREALRAGHEVVVLEPMGSDVPWLVDNVTLRQLAPEALEPESLRALLASLAPTAAIAVSLPSAERLVAVAWMPLWIDLPEGLVPATHSAPGAIAADLGEAQEGLEVFAGWWRLGPLLDRGDGFSRASEAQRQVLVGLLGWRGRFDAGGDLSQLTAVFDDAAPDAPLPEPAASWIAEPRNADLVFAPQSHRVWDLNVRLENTGRQLEGIHGSKMWKLWMGTIALRKWTLGALRWPFMGLPILLWRSLGATLTWARLLGGATLETLMASLRRALRGRRDAASLASLAPPKDPSSSTIERRPRLLIVMPYSIYPPQHGGAVRLYNLVKLLSESCDVHLLVFISEAEDPDQRTALEPYCASLTFHHWQPTFERSATDLAPPSASIFDSARAEQQILDIVKIHKIDVLQLEYTELAQYRRVLDQAPELRVILVEHDVAFRSFWRRRSLGFAQRFPDSKAYGSTFGDWLRLLRYETRACRSVDQLHMMSTEDGRYLAAYLGDGAQRMRVVPNAVDTAYYRPPEPPPERRGVLFVGNFQNLPNLDAFEFFVAEIWPLVRALRPGAELSVVGAKMPTDMRQWDGRDGIHIVGRVPDMRPPYHGHEVLVVPLRAGSGTRLKLFEAFAAGIPAVSTTLGAEGIDCADGEHLLLADDPQSFAQAVDRILGDRDLAGRLAAAAQRLAVERYDWRASATVNLAGIHELMTARKGPQKTSPDADDGEEADRPAVDITVVIPTLNGGHQLELCLKAIAEQQIDRAFEVLCIDSESRPEEVDAMRRLGAQVHGIRRRDFNHGMTRDLGASLARGEVVVFLNQDAVPKHPDWLARLTAPLFIEGGPAAVQGGIEEYPHGSPVIRRFFWDSCGERFYFTRESQRWIARYQGVGFSTINAALRKDAWQKVRFGWCSMMEDKKWQREALETGLTIAAVPEAVTLHTHDYDVRGLARRCQSEGYGWALLGEEYRTEDMLNDLWSPGVWKELWKGLRERRGLRPAEILFPWMRPIMLWWGNHRLRDVKHP